MSKHKTTSEELSTRVWFVGFVTTTGQAREIAVQADDDDAALSRAAIVWGGEPIQRFTYATLIEDGLR